MKWFLLAIALLVAFIVIVLLRRQKTAPKRTGGPQPGEIWWANVPYEDGSGAKVRPCVVLRRASAKRLEVLKITSQDQSQRRDHILIPTRQWDHNADHDSYLDLTDPIAVPDKSFDNKAGMLDSAIWVKVQKLHSV